MGKLRKEYGTLNAIASFENSWLELYEEASRGEIVFGLRTNLPHDFNGVLCSAINDTIQEFLGFKVLQALREELRTKHSVSSDELPYRMTTIYDVLERKFGVKGAKTIGPLIAERFYRKLGIPFHNHEGYRLLDYVEEARIKLTFPKFQ